MDVTKLPNITQSTELAKYQVGPMLFIAFKDIPPRGGIEYLHCLLVIDIETKQPALCVTAERMSNGHLKALRDQLEQTMGKADATQVIENDAPFLCVVDKNDIRSNLGSSSEWENQQAFLSKAKAVAMKRLGLNDQDHPTITKPIPKAENRFGWLWIVAVGGAILSYWIYSNQETKEQKSFMLQCLSQHNDSFCERLWKQRGH